jgi:hypothetical protein
VCVRGEDGRYGRDGKFRPDHVGRLRAMVGRHLAPPFRFICVVDEEGLQIIPDVEFVHVAHAGPKVRLPGWWAKMALFNPEFRGPGKCLYFDLDTVICGDLAPLLDMEADYSTCRNFLSRECRFRGERICRYGTCVEVFADGRGSDVWDAFNKDAGIIMRQCGRLGDQFAVQMLMPDENVAILQDFLPDGFIRYYKHGLDPMPTGTRIMAFGGVTTPENCGVLWVKDAWDCK